jgi:transcriptional regulator with GAF, ATPase, and Fis domain/serine/threonine protein kinase
MPASRGVSYQLLSLLAEHPPFQVWHGLNTATGEACLVKILQRDGSPDFQAATNLVSGAFYRQLDIHCRMIVVARRIANHNGSLAIEYPFLDGADWQPLSPALLAKHWFELIPQVVLVVDYLHLRGLVHADLKLENFLVARINDKLELKLIDLDFLQTENSKPEGVVFGTPGHIAPELLANDRIVAQSDIYSLGISMQRLLPVSDTERLPETACDLDLLRNLIADLTTPDAVLRPRHLIDALARHQLLPADSLEPLNKRLLAMLAVGKLAGRSRESLRSKGLAKFTSIELRLFGLPQEFHQSSQLAARRSLSRTLSIWRHLISESHVGRQAEFFGIEPSDPLLFTALDQLDHIIGKKTDGDIVALTPEVALKQAQACYASSEPLRGMRIIAAILDDPSQADSRSIEEKVQLFAQAAKCATGANRQRDAAMWYQKAAELATGEERQSWFNEALASLARASQFAEGKSLLAKARSDASFVDGSAHSLWLLRTEAWIAQIEGRLDEAEEILLHIEMRSKAMGIYVLHLIAIYMRAVIAFRRGDLAVSLELAEQSIRLTREHGFPERAVPVLIFVAQINSGMSQYVRSIRNGRRALELARQTQQSSMISAAEQVISAGYARLVRPHKARFWLQQMQFDYQFGSTGNPAQGYYPNAGFIYNAEGNVNLAKAQLSHALSLSLERSDKRNTLKAYQNLIELALWQGQYQSSKVYAERAAELSRDVKDRIVELECAQQDDFRIHLTGGRSDKSIAEIASELAKRRSVYCAITGIFYLLFLSEPIPADLLELAASIRGRRGTGPVPLFTATFELLREYDTKVQYPRPTQNGWRQAYQALSSGNQYFLAMLAALKVAELYIDSGSYKRARNYLVQAKKHALSLENQTMAEEIEQRIKNVEEKAGPQSSLIDSLLAVSAMMKDLASYRQVLDQLLRFAVDQTGAERGIIFLKRPDRPGLQPVASYNCDAASVRDLGDFSATIPLNSITSLSPVFIENAMEDSRTRQYQSVVAHNILSVAAIPLMHEKNAIGVLYLDHHALPALFGKDDQKLMAAISNFIVVTILQSKDLLVTKEKASQFQTELQKVGLAPKLVTQDPHMLELMKRLPKIAQSSVSILIVGETGTGKEILCEEIRQHSLRANGPFIKMNCAGLTPTLLDAELFGVAKGAATGTLPRPGHFERADGGTLFLDEIADMPQEMQTKLLRVLEYPQFERVGGTESISVDVRSIFATHQDLDELVKAGKFRKDLYHRIAKVVIEIPPLRERRGDIPLLIEYFTDLFSVNKLPPRLTNETYALLLSHPWPGNIRQLRHTIEYCCLFFAGEEVAPSQLPAKILKDRATTDVAGQAIIEAERDRIKAALDRSDGNQSKAAKSLGMSLGSFRRRMKKYGLDI